MRMSTQEFRNEYLYNVTMGHVERMLARGLITEEEYQKVNRWMKEKYNPVSDGLISESDLQTRKNRAIMGTGKEAGSLENKED